MELFFLPANSAVESVYYWVNSSNKEIFKLMPWLVYLDLSECFRLIIIWVAWTNESNSGSNRWVFKELFDRQYRLIWIYFRLFTFERDILRSLVVAVGMG